MNNIANQKEKRKVFSEDEIIEICRLYQSDISTVKIGRMFGVSNHKISNILKSKGIVPTGVGRRKYKLNEQFFDIIDTEEKAYILGLLYADGNNNMSKHTVSICLEEGDKDILEQIREIIKSEKPLEFIDYSDKHDFGYTYKNQYRLNMFSAYMCRKLNELGMKPRKSWNAKYPNWIDNSLNRHFIRGYFDGNGSVYYKKGFMYANITATEDFLCGVKKIVEDELDIKIPIYDASNHNGITKATTMNRPDSKKFLGWIYDDSNIALKRKKDKYIMFE